MSENVDVARAIDQRALDRERVLVLMRHVGRGKASCLGDAELTTEVANVIYLRQARP